MLTSPPAHDPIDLPEKYHSGDLKQMHKSNVDSLDSGGRVAQIPAATSPYASKPAGISSSEPPVQARGKLFNELELYKECLKQQIEEKRRKEAEERERSRLEDEKEERRLAEQRARIEREYEEEQERKRQKEKEHIDTNGELIRQAEERRKEAEKMKKEEEEKEDEALRERHEREMQTHLKEVHRAPSPPLPALQKRLRKQIPRPPSAESHRSSATVSMHSMSAPHSPPVPARRNEIRATEEKQTVIRELSALRRQLRSEQRRLEGQLMQSNTNYHIPPVHGRPREHLREDVFDVARLRRQVPSRRPASHTTAATNMHNLQDFNHLKYREGASREEVRQAYPDPPSDDHSLDIQQQALFRQQQRTINSLRRGKAAEGASREEVRQAYPDPPSDDHSLDIQQQALFRQQQRTINSLRRGKAAEGASREEVRQAYPDPPSDDHSLDIQQQALFRQQQRTINSLRRGKAAEGASREEVRQAYPDPPSDDHSLDIQQQALFRQQQRTINSLRRGKAAGGEIGKGRPLIMVKSHSEY
ncbi:unnamed protein product [Leuciscus chuanchicus]